MRSTLWVVGAVFTSICLVSAQTRLQVVATTSMMETVLRQVGGKHVQVSVLIPPSSCPGHYDLRPGDLAAVNRTGILFRHGWEAIVQRIQQAAGKPIRIHTVQVAGNWLTPELYIEAGKQVAHTLSQIDPANRAYYQRNSEQLRQQAQKVAQAVKQQVQSTGLVGTPVICSAQQASLLSWLGLEVVGTYGRTEDLTPTLLHQLIQEGKQRKIRLVVDNLQSGADTGVQLAKELGARHVVLSNFPGGFPNTSTWEQCLRHNVDRLVLAVRR